MSGPSPRPDEPAPDGATNPRNRATGSGSVPVELPEGSNNTPTGTHSGAARSDSPEVPMLATYRIIGKLGEGGMGTVYLAEDTKLGRKVAIKTIRRELAANKRDRDRFEREARAAARVAHDNIVPILHVGEESSGAPFIVMPFLQGEPLDARLRREPVAPLDLLLMVAREVADGLAAAHAEGLIHRDIKPANIWLEGAPASHEPAKQVRRCRILDFGLARSVDMVDVQLTANGAILGTPAYMAPEQARGVKVDHRADLWSLGVTLYRMATGMPPFTGDTALALFAALAADTPRPVRELVPHVPQELAQLIEKMLSKDPKGRPQSASGVADAVRRIEAELARPLDIPDEDETEDADEDVARPEPPPARERERKSQARTKRWLFVGAAVLFLTCTAIGTYALMRPGKTEREEDKGTGTERAARPDPKPPEKGNTGEADKKPAPPSKENPKVGPPPKTNPPAPKDGPGPKWLPGDQMPPDGPGQKYPVPPPMTGWPPKELVTLYGDERLRHWAPVTALAGSANGRWIATVTQRAGTSAFPRYVLHLWDAATGKEVATGEDQGYCMAVAFAPDSRRLAVNTGTVTLWDFSGEKLRKGSSLKPFAPLGEREIPGPSSNSNFFRVSFSPGGKTLVAAGVAGTVWRWTLDGIEATPDDVLPRVADKAKVFALSADGATTAWAEQLPTTRKTRIWVRRPDDQKPVELEDSINEVSDLALSPDGRVLAAIAGGQVLVWNLSGEVPQKRPPLTPLVSNPHIWSLSPDGRFIVVGSYMSAVRYIDLRDPKPEPKEFAGASVDVGSGNPASWLGADNLLLRYRDGTVRVWRWKDGAFELRDDWYAGHAGPVNVVAFGADGAPASVSQRFDAHDRERTRVTDLSILTVWPQKPGARPITAALARGWFNGITFAADGNIVACGSEQEPGKAAFERRGFVRRYNSQTGTVIDSVPNVYEFIGVSFSADGTTAAAVTGTGPMNDRFVQLYQTNPLKPRGAPVKTPRLQTAALTGDGKLLATGNENANREGGVVRLWDIGAGAPQERPEPLAFGPNMKAEALAFAPDGKRLASPALGLPYVWDVATRRERTGTRETYGGHTTALAWTPDGKFLAMATSDTRVALYAADAPEKRLHEWRFPGPVGALAFDRTGTRLATGNANGTVAILNVETLLTNGK